MNDCFRCDNTRLICDVCGESESACECEEEHTFSQCPECKDQDEAIEETGDEKEQQDDAG